MSVSIDTNILVYAINPGAGSKHRQASDLLERALRSPDVLLVLQVLTEFYSVAVRKFGGSPATIRQFIQRLRSVLPVHPLIETDLDDAMYAVERHGLAFWDALIWATCKRVGVMLLLTEDFQSGRQLDGVTFLDPFQEANAERLQQTLA